MTYIPFWVLALTILFTSTASAGDWPQFRGPTGQGLSEAQNVPVEWSSDRNVQWRVPIAGKGWSSPVYRDGRIYLTTAAPASKDDASLSLRAICLLGSERKDPVAKHQREVPTRARQWRLACAGRQVADF